MQLKHFTWFVDSYHDCKCMPAYLYVKKLYVCLFKLTLFLSTSYCLDNTEQPTFLNDVHLTCVIHGPGPLIFYYFHCYLSVPIVKLVLRWLY